MKKPISLLLAVLMIVGMFASVPFTASAEDKVIGAGVIYKQGDTIVLPGNGIYIKRNKYESAREVHVNGTVTRFEDNGYSYTLEIEEWGVYAYLDTFEYWEEMEQGQSVLGITFSGSGTESDPYMPKLAFGEVESTWAGEGEGTEASPWLIKDLNDLRTLSANVASGMTYSGKYLKLAADIDCGSDNWETIGGDKSFAGTFDGDGKTITYSIICSENDAPKGLFAKIGSAGTVKNLNVAGSIVNTAEYAGPAGGIAAYNSGLIENCYSAVDINKGCDRGTGGIAAWNDEGATIRYCAASGTLTWTGGSDFYAYIGGITGENYNYNVVSMTNCAMLGDVLAENSDGDNYVGRLIGRQYDASSAVECYYLDTMTVTGVVNSDSVTAKTADELKEIGQAAIDAGYTVYGLALGGSLSNPDQEAADAVIALIDAIGTVEYTDACKAKIDAARAAYDLLTDAQKELVINYATLTDAETAYANLKAAADAAADPVSYLVWDDAARKLVEMTGDNACKTYTEVTADTATFEDGMWYVVNGEILNGNRITVTGTAHLILTDGSKLTTNNGINVANGSTLNIYGQGAGTGTVTANGGSNKGAGIGGKQNESGGTVNIYGGTVTATGSGGGAGIGGGWASAGTGGTGGTITIYGGTVTANGSGMGGAGIGGGTSQSAGIVTIYGGTVTANGNYTSPGIGPGAKGDGGTLTVCGGSVTAVGADRSIAIACTVKNTIPGTGWENVNGTGDETPIAINTEGQEYGFKKIQFLGVASNPDQEAADAVIALIDAIGTVEYTDACKAKIDAARNAYDALTDTQKELVTNYTTLTDAETAYANLKAAAEAAAALAQAKIDAKAEVEAYKNADDYREAEQADLADAITAGKAAIENAADTDAVATALANAKAAIDEIKTDAQMTAEELAAAKRTAKSALLSYKDTHDYRAEQKAELSNAIDDGIAAINAATNTDEVAAALEAAKAVMDAIKTDAQLTAEEAAAALAQAKTDAKAELANYKDPADYRPAQQTELTNAIAAGNDAIDAAASTDDVATALANAKAAIDAIKTDAQLTAEEAAAAAPQDQVSATISDMIEVNFMLDLDKRTDPQTITVAHYKLIDGTNYELIETLTVNAADLTKKGSLYYLTLPVAPAQGADRYVLSVDGEPIAQDIFSVKDYCEYIIANGSNPAYAPYVDLATAMLEYCQAANAYFDYIPVNFAETTNAQAAIDTASGLTGTLTLDENARTYFKAASYMALTVPEYRFYVKEGTLTEAQAAALNSKITVTGPKGVKAQFVKNTDKDDAILLEVTGIDVEHMDEAVTITIEGVGTITFCGNDFARLLAKNTATAVLGAALYNYGVEAEKCFGNNG